VVDVVDREPGADPLEQVARGGRGDRAADATDERRARLGLRIQRLDGFFDLFGAGDADLGFIELRDRGVERDGCDVVFVQLLLVDLIGVVGFGDGGDVAAAGSDDGNGCKNCIQPCPGAPRFDH
jgi:hypothetical protein